MLSTQATFQNLTVSPPHLPANRHSLVFQDDLSSTPAESYKLWVAKDRVKILYKPLLCLRIWGKKDERNPAVLELHVVPSSQKAFTQDTQIPLLAMEEE